MLGRKNVTRSNIASDLHSLSILYLKPAIKGLTNKEIKEMIPTPDSVTQISHYAFTSSCPNVIIKCIRKKSSQKRSFRKALSYSITAYDFFHFFFVVNEDQWISLGFLLRSVLKTTPSAEFRRILWYNVYEFIFLRIRAVQVYTYYKRKWERNKAMLIYLKTASKFVCLINSINHFVCLY